MFNKIAVLCLLSISLSASGQKLLLYKDACDDNRFGWPILKTGSVTDSLFYYLENGGFVVDNKRHKGAGFSWVKRSYGANAKANTSVQVDISQLAGEDNRGYGLMVNGKDGKNYVYFIITSTGNYGIAAMKDGKSNGTAVPWTLSSLIKKGLNASNRLKIEQRGDNYSFYINDVLIKKIDFIGQPFDAFFGQFVAGSVRSKIDNIEIYQWLPDSDLPRKIGSGYVSSLSMPVATKPIPSKDGKPAIYSVNTGVKTTTIFGTPGDKYLYGLKDKDGYRLFDPLYSFISSSEFDGFVITQLKDKDSEGILTPQLEPLVPNILQSDIYRTHWFTNEGYLSCTMPNGLSGVIDKTGKTVLPFVYQQLGDVSDGVIFAQRDGLWGVVDLQGNTIIEFGVVSNNVFFKRVFRNGIAIVAASIADGGNVGLINKNGEWVVLPKYGLIRYVEQIKTYITENTDPDNNKKTIYSLLDEAGKPLPIQSYNYIYESGQNYIVGNGVCNESAGATRAGESAICKFGLIDKNGKVIIPLQYDFIGPFLNGVALTKKGTETFYIDKTGKKVKTPEVAAPVKSKNDPVTELPPIRK